MEKEKDYFEYTTHSETAEQEYVTRLREFVTLLLSSPGEAVVQLHLFRPLTFKK